MMLLAPLLFLSVSLAAAISLPGGPPVGMDYLAYDSARGRIWVPAGNTGAVDVVDIATGKVRQLGGFPTKPSRRPDRPAMGPSSATVGAGAVWIGNRGDNKLCAFDADTLERRACIQLASMPDGLAYVATTRELWVTTPANNTIAIVNVSGKMPGPPTVMNFDGSPEGYAVDDARGIFYTNLEDKDQTLAIDVKSRKVVSTWPAGCGADGPRGLAIDGVRRLLFVACTNGAVTLDMAHDGKPVGRLRTGGGVDNIDYLPRTMLLYVASARDATLTIARAAPGGALTVVGTALTAPGARNPIVDVGGTAYVEDSRGGKLIVVHPPTADSTAPAAPDVSTRPNK